MYSTLGDSTHSTKFADDSLALVYSLLQSVFRVGNHGIHTYDLFIETAVRCTEPFPSLHVKAFIRGNTHTVWEHRTLVFTCMDDHFTVLSVVDTGKGNRV